MFNIDKFIPPMQYTVTVSLKDDYEATNNYDLHIKVIEYIE